MPTYPLQTQKRMLGGLLLWDSHPMFCRDTAVNGIKNGSGAAVDITDPLGYPVKSDGSGGYSLAFAGDEANVIGLVLWEAELSIAAGQYGISPIPILVRGPAVINYTYGIPTVDGAGNSFNITTIVNTLEAISPRIQCLAEPTIVATQIS